MAAGAAGTDNSWGSAHPSSADVGHSVRPPACARGTQSPIIACRGLPVKTKLWGVQDVLGGSCEVGTLSMASRVAVPAEITEEHPESENSERWTRYLGTEDRQQGAGEHHS
jgi:hypothetical protein